MALLELFRVRVIPFGNAASEMQQHAPDTHPTSCNEDVVVHDHDIPEGPQQDETRSRDVHEKNGDVMPASVADECVKPVSYTHLTLPTIYSV